MSIFLEYKVRKARVRALYATVKYADSEILPRLFYLLEFEQNVMNTDFRISRISNWEKRRKRDFTLYFN